jgi:methylthioribose-1-phosphate isomerase
MLSFAREKGKDVRVICTETGPTCRGAADGMVVSELASTRRSSPTTWPPTACPAGLVSKVFAAADRVAVDGTVANKVGTLQLAICADYFRIPYYILAYGGRTRRRCAGGHPDRGEGPREVLEFRARRSAGPT